MARFAGNRTGALASAVALALLVAGCSGDLGNDAGVELEEPAADTALGDTPEGRQPSGADIEVVDLSNDYHDIVTNPDGSPAEPAGPGLKDFRLNGTRWTEPVVKWIVDPPEERLRRSAVVALNAWDSVTKNLDFAEAATAADAKLVIRRNDGLGDGIGGVAERRWFTIDGVNALSRVNIDINMTGTAASHDNHLTAVVMHEVGHGIGLGHSTRGSGANMSESFIVYNGTPYFNYIIEEDIQGAQNLYGMVHSSTYRYLAYPWVVTGVASSRTNSYAQWGFVDADIARFRNGSQLLNVVCPRATIGCK